MPLITIPSLIQLFDRSSGIYARIENPGFMRLVIEDIGPGPRGYRALSLAHYFECNGDLCQDPEVGVELVPQPDGSVSLEPFFFQTAVPPIYQEVYPAGATSGNLVLKRKLTEFLAFWDRNLGEQGFLREAEKQRRNAEGSHAE